MRECDRQQNRQRQAVKDRAQRAAEHVVKAAHRHGGTAQAVTHDDQPGVVSFDAEVPRGHKGCFINDLARGTKDIYDEGA